MSHDNHQKTVTSFVYASWQLAVFILLPGDSYAVTTLLTCPQSYPNGVNVSATCAVDVSDVNRICLSPPVVNLDFKSVSGSSDDLCSTSYSTCSPPVSGARCGCENQTSTTYTYSYNFVAYDTLHKGGNLTCTVTCTYAFLPTTQTVGMCTSISFGENRSSSGFETDRKIGLGVGLGVGITAVLIIVVSIVCVLNKTNLCCSNTPNTAMSTTTTPNTTTTTPHTTPTTTTTTTTPNTTTNTKNGR